MNDKIGEFEIEVRNRKIVVEVTNGGQFKAEIGEKRFNAVTLDGLRTQVLAHTKKTTTKVAVSATYITTNGTYGSPEVAKPVTLTGIHAKDGDVLFRYDDTEKADRAGGGMRSKFLAPMSAAERTLFNEKSKARHETTKDLEAFMKKYEFRAEKAVEEAIEKVSGY